MSNVSALHAIAVNIRAAGSKDTQTGLVHGGIYFPEHVKDGKTVNARWEGNCIINHLAYTDSQGVLHEPSNDSIRVVAWNSRNSAAGKGLADIFAKIVSVGKEFSCSLRINQYMKRLIINGVPLADSQGQPIMYPGYNWVVKDDLIWGDDSAKVIAQEISNWTNYPFPSFYSRPTFWNVPGHGDNEAWKYIVQQRMAEIFKGESTYGYARVMIPEGAQLVNRAAAPQIVQQPQPMMPPKPMVQPMMQQPMQMPQPMAQPMTQQPMQMPQPMMQQPMAQPMQPSMMQPSMQPSMQQPMQQPMQMPAMPSAGTPMQPTAAATTMMNTPI